MPSRLANGVQLSARGTLILDGAVAPEGAVTAPPGSKYHRTTGQEYRKATGTGNTGWIEFVTPIVQEVPASWTGDGPAYFLARSACTLSNPLLKGGGTPAVAYAYAADGVTFGATAPTFPLTMAAGSVLRITLSGFNTWAAWTAERR